ncbi:MAG: DUF2029 domain-containing protein [Gemmatimonadetes bacterium]|nr:DUF2029 domain-containing protein [Gemmatimonadota bacterium]NNM06526.1 DUF2029 domain-containing protein [Gemmatimonadota bacterium]
MLSRRLLLVALFTCVTLGFTILVAEQGIRNYLPSDAFPEANGVLFGGDYLAFYVGGRLFIEDRDRLYDLDYQEEYRTALLGPIPESVSSHLPFVYPPLVGALMAPFSKLPFRQSFWTWMVLGLGVSLFSLALIARTFRAHEIVPLP